MPRFRIGTWKQRTEKSESTPSVASAQFWLKTSLQGYRLHRRPRVSAPLYFKEAIAADDDSIRVLLPSNAFAPRSGRYIVDLLHKDPTFQGRLRLHFAIPCASSSSCLELTFVTRHSTLERDTEAILRHMQLHIIPKGFFVAARKAKLSSGASHAVQCSKG